MEPTDRALMVQGLKRGEYDLMSRDGKDVIDARSSRLIELANVRLATDLLNQIAESGEEGRAYVGEILEGMRPEFEENVRAILREYIEADVKTSIGDYHKIKYGGGLKAIVEPAKPAVEPVKAPVRAVEQVRAASPEDAKPPMSPDDTRKLAVAGLLARRERRDVDSALRTESDIISLVITISDENMAGGLSDESVFRAADAMVQGSMDGVQFIREALMPEHREVLLRIAKASG